MKQLNKFVAQKLKTLKSCWGLFALFFVLFAYTAQAQTECQWTVTMESNWGDGMAWELTGPDGEILISKSSDNFDIVEGTFTAMSAGPVNFFVDTTLDWGDNTASYSIQNENGIVYSGSIPGGQTDSVSGLTCDDEGEPAPDPCEDAMAFDGNEGSLTLACHDSNMINSGNVELCGSASGSYLGGNESVITYNPTESGIATIDYEGQSWNGIFVFEGCPTAGGNCVGSASTSSSSNSLTFPATEGTEYYIVIDTWPSPQSPCPGTMSIELEDGCEGTPDAGNIAMEPTSGPAGTNTVTITGSGYAEGAGIVYAWNYSVNGEEWQTLDTTTPDEANLNLTGAPDDEFEIKLGVTCELSEETSFSNSVFYTFTGLDDYCEVEGGSTYGISLFETTGGIENISNQSGADGYSDYTGMVVSQLPGESIDFSITQNTGTAGMAIWIDWDNDNYFADSEKVFNAGSYVTSAEGTITVPEGTPVGDYRMRVVSNYLSTNPTPCGLMGSSSAYGEAEDYTFSVIESGPCLGADAGEAAESYLMVCAETPFTLSTVGATSPADGNVGLSRVWQSSPAGEDNWSDIEGVNGSTLSVSTGISESTDYRFVVTCDDDTDMVEFSVELNPNANECYCTPTTSGSLAYIENFTATGDGSQNISNQNSGSGTDGYSDFSDMEVSAAPGEEVSISVGMNSGNTAGMKVWVDWSQDGAFNDDDELIYESISYSGQYDISIPVPSDANGNYRMRVGVSYTPAGGPAGACGHTGSGEFEDYTIQVGTDIIDEPLPCSQEIAAPDEFENGYGNLGNLIFANDLVIDAGGTFTLQSLDFNLLISPGANLNAVDVYYYEDTGNGPGEEIDSQLGITPSIDELGEISGFNYWNVSLDTDEITFEGEGGESAVWVGIQLDTDAESTYMEVTETMNTPQTIHYLDPDFGWQSSQQGFDAETDGIISFYGICGQLPPCQGTPDAGAIVGDTDRESCPNRALSISVSGQTSAGAMTYQWQMSTDGGDTWTDIEDANSTTLTLPEGIDEPADFRFAVTCDASGETAYSEVVSVEILPGEECYCEPVFSTGCDLGDYIDDFVFMGENGTSIEDYGTGCSENGYDDRTDQSVDVAPGEVYEIEISVGEMFDSVVVWIDFNDDGTFSEDEKLGFIGDMAPNVSETMSITIPSNATSGPHRMRAMVGWFMEMDEFDPCNANAATSWGEVHDYMVNVIALDGCTDAEAGTPSETELEVCADRSFTISVSGASDPADGLTRVWQSSPAGADDWTDIEGANSTTYQVPGISEETDFRFSVTCSATGDSDFSDIISVSLKPGNECYCIPVFNSGCVFGDEINDFTLTGENDTSIVDLDTGCSDNSYEDKTHMSVDLFPGESYNAEVTSESSPMTVVVWIDLDDSGTFEDSEKVGSIEDMGSGVTGIIEILVPDDAAQGTHRMRVMTGWLTPADEFGPCNESDISYGEVHDYTVNILELTGCTDADPGTPEETEIDICAGYPFTISVNGASSAAEGLTRQWESTLAGEDNWQPIEGATSTTLQMSEGISQDTDYRYRVHCESEGEAHYSEVISVTMLPDSECFCIPSLDCTDGDMITNVTFGDINNDSGCSPNGYGDYTDMEAFVAAGDTYPISVTVGDGWSSESVSVWIDYNGNGSFEEDEFIYLGTGSAETLTGNITIPQDVANGTYRMRVRVVAAGETSATPDMACDEEQFYGETEDYTVQVGFISVDKQIFDSFTFYPNPAENEVNLNATEPIDQVTVYNLLGQQVLTAKPGTTEAQINVERLESGIYAMQVIIDGSQKTFKIIKK